MASNLQLPTSSPQRQQAMFESSAQLAHNPVRILIGPPIDNWFKSEPWSLLASERKASAHEIAQSLPPSRRPGK
ncbi:hypothetical protein DSO57_1017937 [Entomophthora muscae]|uniref:Uncharacterized protein n=1 Tax=Entomophthora muscae TaxID=34485 RepID=A0ACC2RVP4_9FUNG|nr:hypothetical protein DSO57_1017937 [Entomophthora muscae]